MVFIDKNKCNFVNDILLLGISEVGKDNGNKSYDIFTEVSPYINDIFNIITLTITKPYFNFNIYAHSPKNLKEKIIKVIIDMVSTFGIAATASQYSAKYNNELIGLVKGMCLTLFGFFFPDLILNPILKLVKYNLVKFILGIFVIFMLDFLSNIVFCIFISNYKYNNYKREDDVMPPKLF